MNEKKRRREEYFLFAGRLSGEKGAPLVIEAFRDLPDVQVRIAGSGPEEARLKVLAKDAPNIEFVGYQNKESLQQLIVKAQAVLVPSQCYENAPYAVTEVMAQGGLVIGSDHGGIPELLGKNEERGLLFTPGSVEELKNKISEVIDNKEQMKDKSTKAIQFAKEKLTKEVHYEKVMELYQKTLRNADLH